MSVMLLTPFTMVNRRSAPMGGVLNTYNPAGDFLTGRWVIMTSSGEIQVPGTSGVRGAYLLLEGNLGHNGTAEQFGNSGTGYASTSSFELPSVQQSGECALVYGVFRFQVGPEGVNPADTGLQTVGNYWTIDGYGRIVAAASGGVAMGRVESVSLDGSNNISEFVGRTFGY